LEEGIPTEGKPFIDGGNQFLVVELEKLRAYF
jgi:hypothetical protein